MEVYHSQWEFNNELSLTRDKQPRRCSRYNFLPLLLSRAAELHSVEIGLQIRRLARKARPYVACRSLFVVPFVLELSGRVLSYSDKLWERGEDGGGGGVSGQKGRKGLRRDWELGGGSPSPLPAIVSASSVVSPKSPLPALRASLLLLLLHCALSPPNSTLFHRPVGYYTAHLPAPFVLPASSSSVPLPLFQTCLLFSFDFIYAASQPTS